MAGWESTTGSEEFDARPVRAFRPADGTAVDESVWPVSVPAMAQLLPEGLELPTGLTGRYGGSNRAGPTWTERRHELSHGEAFLEILRTGVNETGFYLMDEPDAPLSFTASLGLAALLHDLAAAGGRPAAPARGPEPCPIPCWASTATGPTTSG